ncbi:MAG: TetR/AcrR family transcriptional regulator [Solirubrobacteraceae bacterium]
MATNPEVTPNRRGMKSRELVLDAAERVMAEEGFEAATVARVVEEAGIPLSSVYHYYGSKEGILLAVMMRGAGRFFADLPDPGRRTGRPAEHLSQVVSTAVERLKHHPNFLRLLIVFAIQPPRSANGEVAAVVGHVREMALQRLRKQIATAFDDDPHSPATDQLARFALAAFDGAFLASQADPGIALDQVLGPLAAALVAARRRLLGKTPARPPSSRRR